LESGIDRKKEEINKVERKKENRKRKKEIKTKQANKEANSKERRKERIWIEHQRSLCAPSADFLVYRARICVNTMTMCLTV